MKNVPLELMMASVVLLALLPVVDLVGSQQNMSRVLESRAKPEGIIVGSGEGTDNQTAEGKTLAPRNWNSLSPTLSHNFPIPASTSTVSTRTMSHEMLQSSPSSSTDRHYNFPLSSTSSFSLPRSGLRTSEQHAHVLRSSLALTTISGGGGGGSGGHVVSNQLLSSAVEIPLPLASSSRVTGPYFESNKTTIHISAKAGQNVILDCAVILLQGRTVSWLRRGKDSLQLLTVGNTTYYSDSRLGLRFRYPNNWRLGIESVNKGDEGEYQCQLSTHPPKVLIYHLKVIAPSVTILDENGHTVTSERHYKVDSSLHLTCRASHVDKFAEKVVWLKGDRVLPGGDSRIKVKVTKSEENSGEASTFLSVLSVRKGDSGNYTCRASSLATSTVTVHVLNGELPAAVQHENRSRKGTIPSGLFLGGLLLLLGLLAGTPNAFPFWVSPLIFPAAVLRL